MDFIVTVAVDSIKIKWSQRTTQCSDRTQAVSYSLKNQRNRRRMKHQAGRIFKRGKRKKKKENKSILNKKSLNPLELHI